MSRNPKTSRNLIALVLTALLSAIAVVLFLLLKFPVFPAAAHLKMDFSNIPSLLAGILLGPIYGVTVELIRNLIELVTMGVGTQMGFGNIMSFTLGCAFVVPFSLIVRKPGTARVAAACAASFVVLLAAGVGMNLIFTPLFFRYFLGQELPKAMLYGMIGYATALNAIKGAVLCASGVLFCRLRPKFQNMLGR